LQGENIHPDDLLQPDLLSKTLVFGALVATALAFALMLWLVCSSYFVW
jgi:hypothetical protein